MHITHTHTCLYTLPTQYLSQAPTYMSMHAATLLMWASSSRDYNQCTCVWSVIGIVRQNHQNSSILYNMRTHLFWPTAVWSLKTINCSHVHVHLECIKEMSTATYNYVSLSLFYVHVPFRTSTVYARFAVDGNCHCALGNIFWWVECLMFWDSAYSLATTYVPFTFCSNRQLTSVISLVIW